MESLIIQRISSILDHNKVTKQNLANEINMNQTTLGRQLKGILQILKWLILF